VELSERPCGYEEQGIKEKNEFKSHTLKLN
jgi:hypothetical protein